jgi:signal transduction histidine kinase/CheY-like chemotaxis protein
VNEKGSSTFPIVAPASSAAQQWALAISTAFFVLCGVIIPFSKVPLPHIAAFFLIYDTAFAQMCLVAAGFLLFGYRRSRLRAALALATGYLFAALIVVPQVLTAPGAFSSGSWLGAGMQSRAWLDGFRQAGLPLCAIGYAMMRRRDGQIGRSHLSIRTGAVLAGAGVVAAVCLLTFLATAGHRLLPRMIVGGRYTTAMLALGVAVAITDLVALAALAARRRYSTLDLWLLVVLSGWLFGVILDTVGSAARFDLGFYAGRFYGLVAVGIVPVVLLVEASRIAHQLDEAIAVAEERNAALMRSREELARAQRLEAIGQLTGGVAHDFNNLLTVVIGNLELISVARGDAARIERLAQNAIKAAQRGEHLVRQLLTYARRQIDRPQAVNVNRLIADGEGLIRRVAGEEIEVATTLNPAPAWVQIDPAQFETALLNLVANSRDAIADGGRIVIETRYVMVDPRQAPDDPEIRPGPHVMVAVSDTGTGMTPAVLARAFDPFFTTKEVGKGSGLGLSQVYGFTKTTGGHVRIRSTLGRGTTVELYLPSSVASPVLPQPDTGAISLPPADGRETILMVEDDEEVLAVTAESLRQLGYRVVTAVNAAQALALLQGDEPIDLLFSDVIIPGGTNGAQLAVAARRVRPALKVLLTSGYTAAALSLEHDLPDDLTIVDKPYRREELARKLRAVIGG